MKKVILNQKRSTIVDTLNVCTASLNLVQALTDLETSRNRFEVSKSMTKMVEMKAEEIKESIEVNAKNNLLQYKNNMEKIRLEGIENEKRHSLEMKRLNNHQARLNTFFELLDRQLDAVEEGNSSADELLNILKNKY